MPTDPEQLEFFSDRVLLRRVDAERNMRRFYLMTVQRDLFGGTTLMREWGRIGCAGKVRISHHYDEGRAVDALAETARIKQRRGYRSDKA